MKSLAEQLAENTREGALYEHLEGNRIRCYACGHRCPIPAGFAGVCKVRFNRAGKLYVPHGYVNALHCDPIEKKPFYHAMPGTLAMSFGMLGCDLHCPYCQNWVTSQALRDFRSSLDFQTIEAKQIVSHALSRGAESVISTYNEPLITSEWAVEIFREARGAGLRTGFVSNGNATIEVLRFLRPWLDLFKVDLKTFDDRRYHELGGRLAPILDSIGNIHELGFWLEVVTLVIPGFNDSDQELDSIARFLAGISANIPWHVTAFHRDYKMFGPENTSAETLRRAVHIGRAAGLRYVYAGNLPGAVGDLENTHCHQCGELLVRRTGFRVMEHRISESGCCSKCGTVIPGVWSAAPRAGKEAAHFINGHCG